MGDMKALVAVGLVVGLAGCGGNQEDGKGAKADRVDQTLVGAYERSDDGIADFVDLDLRADGTFSADRGIVCSDAPCDSGFRGTWRSSDFVKHTRGTLVLLQGDKEIYSYDATLTRKPKKLRLARADADEGARDATFEWREQRYAPEPVKPPPPPAPAPATAPAPEPIDKAIAGTWYLVDRGDFSRLELHASGHFLSDEGIKCGKAPCPSGEESGTWRVTDLTANGGKLHLARDGKAWHSYDFELEGSPAKLRLRRDGEAALFKRFGQ